MDAKVLKASLTDAIKLGLKTEFNGSDAPEAHQKLASAIGDIAPALIAYQASLPVPGVGTAIDVTMAPAGSVPNAAGASISPTQVLTLQPASAAFSGLFSASDFSKLAAITGTNTGNVTVTTVGASPNANGLTLTGQALNLELASASFPGLISSTQFTKLANTTNTNSGDITLGATGSTANSSAASLSGQVLTLQPSSASFAGLMTSTQFSLLALQSGTNTGDVTIGTFGSSPTAKGISISSQVITQQPADATHPGAISLFAQTLGAGTKTVDALAVTGIADVSGQITVGTTVPALHDLTTYKAVWFPGSVAIQGEPTSGFENLSWATNRLRISPSLWAQTDASKPTWACIMGHGSSIDYFRIVRTAPGGNPNSVGSPLLGVNSTGTTIAGTLTVSGATATVNGVSILDQTNTVSGITNKTFTSPTINALTGTGTWAMGTTIFSGTPNFSGVMTIGGVTALSQTNTVSGITNKTFTTPTINGATLTGTIASGSSTFTGTNLSGTNTGDITLGTVGSVPNSSGASLSSQVLTLQPASILQPGIVSSTTQTFTGIKTFADRVYLTNENNPSNTSWAAKVDANHTNALGNPDLLIGGTRSTGSGQFYTIAFGNTVSLNSIAPVEIGYVVTSTSSFGKGDFLFATRDVTTDTAPTERMRIGSAGLVGIGRTATTNLLEVAGIIESTSGGFTFPDATTQTTAASAITSKDEGSTLTAATTTLDFVGAGVTASNVGGVVTVTVPGGSGFEALDEGVSLSVAVASVDFVGAGVTATNIGGAITVTIPGGSGSGVDTLDPVGASPNANAATIVGTTLNLEPASASFPGVMTAAQYTNLSNQSGTNTGDQVAGAGLTGTSTLNVIANADASIVVNANDIQVGVINATQHGTLAGGTTHADAVAGVSSGFLSAAGATVLAAQSGTNTGDAPLTSKDEGSTLTSATTTLDFVGAGVTASNVGGVVTVTIPGSPGGGVDTLAAVGAVPNANAATIVGTTLNLQPADGSFPGVMTSAQFTKLAGIATGATAEVDADATHAGRVTLGAQTFGTGTKTMDAAVLTGASTMGGVALLSQTNTVSGITNKTFTSPTINALTGTGTWAMGTTTFSGTPDFSGAVTIGSVVALSQTNSVSGITNKTFTSPTINAATFTGTLAMGTSTLSGTPNFSGAATIGGVDFLSQTNTITGITNKTFTSPTINSATTTGTIATGTTTFSGTPTFSGNTFFTGHTTQGTATVPAAHTSTGYKSIWFEGLGSMTGEVSTNFANITQATNRARSSGSNWVQIDTGKPTWWWIMGHGSSVDYFRLGRTAAGGDPNAVANANASFGVDSSGVLTNFGVTILNQTNSVSGITNKTFTSPTINAATLTGTISGGTFTSSTLTSPTINTPVTTAQTSPYATGAFTIATGRFSIMCKRLILTSTLRMTAQGTARLRIS